MTPADQLRAALAATTDENLGWIALAIQHTVAQNLPNHGFTRESTAHWQALADALKAYLSS